MTVPIYWVDAFEEGPFTGNPAAVCLLEHWLGDDLMQAIARENNLSETAFLVPADDGWQIRWFTPASRGGAVWSRHPGQRRGDQPLCRSAGQPDPFSLPIRAAAGAP